MRCGARVPEAVYWPEAEGAIFKSRPRDPGLAGFGRTSRMFWLHLVVVALVSQATLSRQPGSSRLDLGSCFDQPTYTATAGAHARAPYADLPFQREQAARQVCCRRRRRHRCQVPVCSPPAPVSELRGCMGVGALPCVRACACACACVRVRVCVCVRVRACVCVCVCARLNLFRGCTGSVAWLRRRRH